MSSRGGASPRDGSTRDEARSELVLGKLQLLITRKLDGLLQGDYLGLLPGPGTEPGESREYRPGDDVRRMDWPVTARTTVAHVRQTVADRELETWIAVDLSARSWGPAPTCAGCRPGRVARRPRDSFGRSGTPRSGPAGPIWARWWTCSTARRAAEGSRWSSPTSSCRSSSGNDRCASSGCATTCSPWRSSTRASWSCPTSA